MVGARPARPGRRGIRHEMVDTGGSRPETYQAALALLGEAGVVELVALCGYYCLVSLTLNAFNVDLPAGAKPVWT
jgi:hypothetical protein